MSATQRPLNPCKSTVRYNFLEIYCVNRWVHWVGTLRAAREKHWRDSVDLGRLPEHTHIRAHMCSRNVIATHIPSLRASWEGLRVTVFVGQSLIVQINITVTRGMTAFKKNFLLSLTSHQYFEYCIKPFPPARARRRYHSSGGFNMSSQRGSSSQEKSWFCTWLGSAGSGDLAVGTGAHVGPGAETVSTRTPADCWKEENGARSKKRKALSGGR